MSEGKDKKDRRSESYPIAVAKRGRNEEERASERAKDETRFCGKRQKWKNENRRR